MKSCTKNRKQRGRKGLLKHINELCGCVPFARERTEGGLKLEMEVTMYFAKLQICFPVPIYCFLFSTKSIRQVNLLNQHSYNMHVPRSWMHWNGWKILRCLVGSKAVKISVNGEVVSNRAACFKESQMAICQNRPNQQHWLSMNHWLNP